MAFLYFASEFLKAIGSYKIESIKKKCLFRPSSIYRGPPLRFWSAKDPYKPGKYCEPW